MRLTREVDTAHGRMLFSPLRAGALEIGDVIVAPGAVKPEPWHVTGMTFSPERDKVTIRHTGPSGSDTVLANYPVLRAVGARSSRMAN